MTEQLLIGLVQTVIGVAIGSYIGLKIGKREIKGEITNYLTNELPHLLQSPELQYRIRQLAHVFFDELINFIIADEDESLERASHHNKRTRGVSEPVEEGNHHVSEPKSKENQKQKRATSLREPDKGASHSR